MTTNTMQMEPTIQYPAKWTPMEFTCECKKKVRVDVEFIAGPYAMQAYQHTCGAMRDMPGPIIASWDEGDDGKWILIAKGR